MGALHSTQDTHHTHPRPNVCRRVEGAAMTHSNPCRLACCQPLIHAPHHQQHCIQINEKSNPPALLSVASRNVTSMKYCASASTGHPAAAAAAAWGLLLVPAAAPAAAGAPCGSAVSALSRLLPMCSSTPCRSVCMKGLHTHTQSAWIMQHPAKASRQRQRQGGRGRECWQQHASTRACRLPMAARVVRRGLQEQQPMQRRHRCCG